MTALPLPALQISRDPGEVWRVGFAPNPWAWTPWEYARDAGRFNGRAGAAGLYPDPQLNAVGLSWLSDRMFGPGRQTGTYAEVTRAESVGSLQAAGVFDRLGIPPARVDASLLKEPRNRKVTRTVARFLFVYASILAEVAAAIASEDIPRAEARIAPIAGQVWSGRVRRPLKDRLRALSLRPNGKPARKADPLAC